MKGLSKKTYLFDKSPSSFKELIPKMYASVLFAELAFST